MRRFFLWLVVSILCSYTATAQEEKAEFTPNGKPFAKVFWNYHYDMTKDVDKTSAFQLQRAYLGYQYAFSENISTKITLDVGSNSGGSAYTAFLKTAQLDWKVLSPVKLSLGLIGMKQWNDQEKFWGYRYISKTIQDEHKFGTSADLGVNAEIKLHPKLIVNLLIVNGGGYKKLQDDYGMHRVGGNIVAQPIKGLTLKAYYTMMPGKEDVNGDGSVIADAATIENIALFVGIKATDNFRIGAEYNMMNNGKKYTDPAEDHNLSGLSIYSTYKIDNKFEIFGRFDQLSSNKLAGATDNWNNSKDGSAIIAGIQFIPVKGLSTSLNYKSWSFTDSSKDNTSKLYLNFEYKF